MVTEQPRVNPNGLYGHKATAEALGIGSQTLYNWERVGILPSRIRKANGRRVWRGEDIIRAWNQVY